MSPIFESHVDMENVENPIPLTFEWERKDFSIGDNDTDINRIRHQLARYYGLLSARLNAEELEAMKPVISQGGNVEIMNIVSQARLNIREFLPPENDYYFHRIGFEKAFKFDYYYHERNLYPDSHIWFERKIPSGRDAFPFEVKFVVSNDIYTNKIHEWVSINIEGNPNSGRVAFYLKGNEDISVYGRDTDATIIAIDDMFPNLGLSDLLGDRFRKSNPSQIFAGGFIDKRIDISEDILKDVVRITDNLRHFILTDKFYEDN